MSLSPAALPDYDLDVAELGERVVDCLDREALGSLYTDLRDRAWSVVLNCYVHMASSLGPENVPPQWQPQFDENGMWHLP